MTICLRVSIMRKNGQIPCGGNWTYRFGVCSITSYIMRRRAQIILSLLLDLLFFLQYPCPFRVYTNSYAVLFLYVGTASLIFSLFQVMAADDPNSRVNFRSLWSIHCSWVVQFFHLFYVFLALAFESPKFCSDLCSREKFWIKAWALLNIYITLL